MRLCVMHADGGLEARHSYITARSVVSLTTCRILGYIMQQVNESELKVWRFTGMGGGGGGGGKDSLLLLVLYAK